MFGETLRRAAYLLRRRRFDTELDDEIRFHMESRAEELEQSGMAHAAAMAQARREFGGGARAREETRAAWQVLWVEDLAGDLRYGGRAMRRNPAFALTAVACLALGIGANTTMFSIAMEVLFSQPSCRHPETLSKIWIGGNSASPMREFNFLRDSHAIGEVAGENEEEEINWRDGDRTFRIFSVRVTENFFGVIGIPLAMGHGIGRDDPEGVVITHTFWRQRLGGDPAVLSRKLVLDGHAYSIIGVLPSDHRTVTGFGYAPDLYVPVSPTQGLVTLYARLPEGMTRAIAAARVKAICQELDRVYPDPHMKWANGVTVHAIAGIERLKVEEELATMAAFFVMLMIVVGLVLAIACANVASLLMARAASRTSEMAVRLSIGAGRGRIVRQLLAESLLLATCGTAGGLAMNAALTWAISRIRLPLTFPIQFQIQPDWRLMAYAGALACGVTLVAGLAPALTAVRGGIGLVLKRGERATGRGRLRATLVAGQVAVSVVLLCAGLLFLRNLLHAAGMNPGFDVQHTVWAYMRLAPENYPKVPAIRSLADRAMDRLAAVPGVDVVSLARVVPLNHPMMEATKIQVDGGARTIRVAFHPNYVTPDYFRAMGIPIVRGRAFTRADREGVPRVAIVNENLARKLFGTVEAAGRTMAFDRSGQIIIAGVAANGKYFTLGEEDACAYYEPYAQWRGWNPDLHFLVRTQGRPQDVVRAIDRTLVEVDGTASVETRPMKSALGMAMLPSQAGAILLGSMGVLGLGLAAIGLYGSLLYMVGRRLREIGVRMALGATPGSVLRMVLAQSFAIVAWGLAVGMAVAGFAVRPLAMFLAPEVRTGDIGNFVAVAAVLCGVALVATLAPALRALRVDPVTALRYE